MSNSGTPDPNDPYGQAPPPGGSNPYGQAPPPGGGYQGMPSMSGGPVQPAPTMEQPGSIAIAVKLMYVGAVISLIGLITTLFTSGSMRTAVEDSLRQQGKSLDASTIDTAVHLGIAIGIIAGLIGIALWVWMAVMNGRGRSWARIVASVLGGLNILFTAASLAQSTSTGAGIALNVISVLLAIAILVLLWRKESSAYFAAQSAPRP